MRRKRLKIGLLIGGLEQGGAEKQLSELAVGLVERGHIVEVISYTRGGYFARCLAESGVIVRIFNKRTRFGKWRSLNRWLQDFKPDVIHAFMKRASVLAILSVPPWSDVCVIASDYSTASYGKRNFVFWTMLAAFSLADVIVTETQMNRIALERAAPWLKRKIRIVRNGVDTEKFLYFSREAKNTCLRFGCVGRVHYLKNPIFLIEALRILRDRGYHNFRLDWYGSFLQGPKQELSHAYAEAKILLNKYELNEIMKFHGPRDDIVNCYLAMDVLVHVSTQEGVANSVVEAMASGLPIIVGRVSDLPQIVQNGVNGYVCNEKDPESIADALQTMITNSVTERINMGVCSHNVANTLFGLERFIVEHENIYYSYLLREE